MSYPSSLRRGAYPLTKPNLQLPPTPTNLVEPETLRHQYQYRNQNVLRNVLCNFNQSARWNTPDQTRFAYKTLG